MKQKRNIISIDESLCNGCGQCVIACAEGAIKIIDGKAKLVSESYCDGLGACLGECPTGALKITEREAETFNETAADNVQKDITPVCPSANARSFERANHTPRELGPPESGLGHWPIQIRLISPNAPFLQHGELFVASDCVPAAWPEFHEAIRGKVVLIGCPKFDDVALYVERFRQIFEVNDIARVTVAVMQVPCCQGLPMIVQEAMRLAGKQVDLHKLVIGLDGRLLSQARVIA